MNRGDCVVNELVWPERPNQEWVPPEWDRGDLPFDLGEPFEPTPFEEWLEQQEQPEGPSA